MNLTSPIDYYRQDQERGITAPDLTKDCTVAEHVVRARGKRTRFTSVSLDRRKIDDFGPALYLALRSEIDECGHLLIEHPDLLARLRLTAASSDKADRVRALQALRYAARRKEGLVEWKFDLGSIERKETIKFAFDAIQRFFQRQK